MVFRYVNLSLYLYGGGCAELGGGGAEESRSPERSSGLSSLAPLGLILQMAKMLRIFSFLFLRLCGFDFSGELPGLSGPLARILHRGKIVQVVFLLARFEVALP